MMTELHEKAFTEASKLSMQEQDVLAAWILEELASSQRSSKAFAASGDILDQLADESLAEHRAGRTQVLDLNKM
jgi:hypothetical protein